MVSKPALEQSASKKWGSKVPIRKLFELQKDETCIVVGTLFKHMQLKPSILRELSEDHNLLPQPTRSKYTDDSDQLILEDELQRIVLVGDIDRQMLVTGITVALLGSEKEEQPGKFHVTDLCFLELPQQPARDELEKDKYVLLVSGFNLGSAVASSMQLEMLVDVVSGQLGGDAEQQFCASISRMIIAGNSLSVETQDKEQHTKAKYITKNVSAGSVEAVKLLDQLLVRLVSSIPVDVMPGEFDPANHALPQQPLHPCILPLASSYPTLTTVSNPYQCSIDGVRFLGSSGQTVKDILKYSDFNSHIDVLEKTLIWCHMAPTAPDTLGCYPYSAEDPFIIEECPHVYFAGNMPSFMTKMFTGDAGQKVLLIGVPDFSATGTCALVNLRTLTCTPMQFDLSQFDCDN